MKNFFLAVLLICTYNSFGQWTEINLVEQQRIEVLSFLDDNLGYVLMKDEADVATIRKTLDGGANWTELNLPTQSGEFQDIYFYAAGEGVVVIRNSSNEVPSMIFRTMDDGANWEDISPETTATGVGVGQCQFLNQNIGFFATDKFLYTTIDGGANWTSEEFNEYILSIDFLDAEHGVLGTWDGTFGYMGGMLTTSDGGITWTNNLLSGNYTSIGEVRQISDDVAIAAPVYGWASIQANEMYKTTDGGANWNTIAIPTGNDFTLKQIDFKDEMNGVICAGNSQTVNVYQTTDGGQTWVEEGVITSTSFTDLQLTPNSGYIAGKIGSFYKRSGSTATNEVPTKVEISLFPSPSKSGQRISWNSAEKFTHLSIIDQKGVIIHRQSLNENHATLPDLIAGPYFVQLLNEKVVTITKIMVK